MWRLQNAAAAHLRQIRWKLTTPIRQSIYKRTSVYSPRVSKKYCQSLIGPEEIDVVSLFMTRRVWRKSRGSLISGLTRGVGKEASRKCCLGRVARGGGFV